MLCLLNILPLICEAEEIFPKEKPLIFSNFDLFGFSFGTPGAINLELGRVRNGKGVRAAGIFTAHSVSGIQLNLVQKAWGSRKNYRDYSIVGGYLAWLDYDYQDKFGTERYDKSAYIGVETTFSWRGLFIAPGIAIGYGDFGNPMILVRLGLLSIDEK